MYEDNHLIAVNKKSGDISQGDKTGDMPLGDKVKLFLKKKYNKPGDVYVGVIHRLDRPTSGVLIFAKTSKALPRMMKLFAERQVEKTYWALVDKIPAKESGTLDNYLWKDSKKNKSYVVRDNKPKSKQALLDFTLIESNKARHLMELTPKTGRHHQIRVQLKHIGCRIIGDMKYGYPTPNKDKSICLHCKKISFLHPVKKEMLTIEAPVPSNGLW